MAQIRQTARDNKPEYRDPHWDGQAIDLNRPAVNQSGEMCDCNHSEDRGRNPAIGFHIHCDLSNCIQSQLFAVSRVGLTNRLEVHVSRRRKRCERRHAVVFLRVWQ